MIAITRGIVYETNIVHSIKDFRNLKSNQHFVVHRGTPASWLASQLAAVGDKYKKISGGSLGAKSALCMIGKVCKYFKILELIDLITFFIAMTCDFGLQFKGIPLDIFLGTGQVVPKQPSLINNNYRNVCKSRNRKHQNEIFKEES